MLRLFFIIECGIACVSALYMYSKFGHHPHLLDYLCARFRFFRSLHCGAPWWVLLQHSGEKTCTQSITHPAYLMTRELKCLHFGI